jgi:hypothetical protein
LCASRSSNLNWQSVLNHYVPCTEVHPVPCPYIYRKGEF